MIVIKYTNTSISISGHAGYGKKGKDIVCAGVSAIIFGAIEWFNPKDIELKQDKKHNAITLVIKNRKKENMMKLDLIIQQLKPITKQFKKYVKISKGK